MGLAPLFVGVEQVVQLVADPVQFAHGYKHFPQFKVLDPVS